jgi:hypothetical protein
VNRLRAAGASASLLIALLCGLPGTASGAATSQVSLPLATTLRTPAGTWATLPMGHLSDPANTFWQLFFEPRGTGPWSDRVEATGVATNGGIVMAATAKSLVVGVLPSALLRFSPLLASTNWGRSWSTGLVQGGLARAPSALAAAPTGQVLALAGAAKGGPDVLSSTMGPSALLSWRLLATAKAFSKAAGSLLCGPVGLTAVAFDRDQPAAGTRCTKAGALGVFEESAGGWAIAGRVPIPAQGPAEVVGFVPTTGGLAALAETRGRGRQGPKVFVAWHSPAGPWRASPPLDVPPGVQLASFGPASGAGVFVLLAGAKERLEISPGFGLRWYELPAPPAGTETLAFGANGRQPAQALVARASTFSAWDLVKGAWRRGQVVHVKIEYGSSSF